MKKIQTLRIAGLTLTTSPLLLTNPAISDLTKGLLMGIGIGLLILSLIVSRKARFL